MMNCLFALLGTMVIRGKFALPFLKIMLVILAGSVYGVQTSKSFGLKCSFTFQQR